MFVRDGVPVMMGIMKPLCVIVCLMIVSIDIRCFVDSKLSVHIKDKHNQRRPLLLRQSAKRFPITDTNDPGKPLFLTPYIEAGKIKKAQKMSKVRPAIGGIESYSGYLTVNKDCGSNLFFWYFPAQEKSNSTPLVLWLQGGPGSSSLFGLFEELGPFNSYPEGLQIRNYSWNMKNDLLFFDQPAGTGFSFTTKGCYATNQTIVGIDMYNALIQFYTLFPAMQSKRLFLTGESYAGHYIPAIAYTIHEKNTAAKLKINLSGIMIGDGWTDPREQIGYGEYLYQTGLIGNDVKILMEQHQAQFVSEVDNKQWRDAYNSWIKILDLFDDNAGVSYYNFLPQPRDRSNWDQFIQTPLTRKAIHVGSLEFDDGSEEVYNHLTDDMPKSVKPLVEVLLEHYPIVFYVGEVDVICGYPMVVNYLRSLKWSGQEKYLNATRVVWVVEDEVAGYIKGYGNMFDVLVRAAGHMVPADQPLWAYELVNAFTSGKFPSFISTHHLPN